MEGSPIDFGGAVIPSFAIKMSRAIFEFVNGDAKYEAMEGIQGSFPFDEAVLEGK